jgi:hypothetical protein
MSNIDFVPRADKLFHAWLIALIAYLKQKYLIWNIPEEEVNSLDMLTTDFDKALKIAANTVTRTKVTVQAKNDARKAVANRLRAVLKLYITYNRAVTDADRDAMGLPIHKTTRTPVADITTTPYAKILLPSPAVVEIDFRDSGSSGKAKPRGAHGVETVWAILDSPPTDWEQLVHSSFSTHAPLRLTFNGSERGKILYFALRWENTRGKKGPLSEIFKVIIP